MDLSAFDAADAAVVASWPQSALRCYRRTGFVAVDAALAAAWNAPQPVRYVWLRYGGPDAQPASGVSQP